MVIGKSRVAIQSRCENTARQVLPPEQEEMLATAFWMLACGLFFGSVVLPQNLVTGSWGNQKQEAVDVKSFVISAAS